MARAKSVSLVWGAAFAVLCAGALAIVGACSSSSSSGGATNDAGCLTQCAPSDAGGTDTGVDSAIADSGPADGGLPTEAGQDGGLVDPTWAQWHMPNSPVDVEAGAPNRESYAAGSGATAGTVTDNVTGLVWQQTPTASDGGVFPDGTQADAIAYCAGLTLAGQHDWRLPTTIELVSILDYGVQANGPTLNQTFFPATPGGQFWASTPYSPELGLTGWQVFFFDSQVSLNPVTQVSNFRCVRGGTGPFAQSPHPAPPGRYTLPTSGTVLDTMTALTWEQNPGGDAGTFPTMFQSDARARCASLGLSGGGWRLPTVNELLTLLDFSHANAATASIDGTYFPGTPADIFWSSTGVAPVGVASWVVGFNGGTTSSYVGSSRSLYVRCVR